jgi:hypothetical protein
MGCSQKALHVFHPPELCGWIHKKPQATLFCLWPQPTDRNTRWKLILQISVSGWHTLYTWLHGAYDHIVHVITWYIWSHCEYHTDIASTILTLCWHDTPVYIWLQWEYFTDMIDMMRQGYGSWTRCWTPRAAHIACCVRKGANSPLAQILKSTRHSGGV